MVVSRGRSHRNAPPEMEVELSRPELLASLIAAFRVGGCSCTALRRDRVTVSHHGALDPEEAWLEVTFFLRAWQREHEPVGVGVVA